ncbi:MAG: hypothetical protein CVU56_25325 [Deltaproteobacteria bacterium HGW-Deltaproteobacteria-14]|jgi:CheY-like chemotaxis protein|nr:MAG: hypothetical protein CVU56_25325 [Deltaproteobacteria bacterium HGW-Deltaproteobacteria-14]
MSDAPSRHPSTQTLLAAGATAGRVAHDFDNALTAIVTHATLIRVAARDPELVAHADAILRASRAASGVVDRVRALFSRRDPGGRVQVDLAAVIEEAAVVVAARGLPRAVTVDRAIAPCGPVAGSPDELLQLLINLGSNAVDASPDGATVTLSVAEVEGRARCEVRDHGRGVPPELAERIFEPFFTTRGAAGTGLGLAICRTICQDHGGTVALEPAPGGGTRALVELPLAPGGTPRPEVATATQLHDVARGLSVLLVDDDAHVRDALAILMEASGLEATAVATVDAALQAFSASRPDVVVTDLRLGEGDGRVLIARLAALSPTTPIVVCSGDLREGEALRRRVSAVVSKPVNPGALVATVRRLGAERRALLRVGRR